MGTQLVAEGQISNEILSSILEKQEKLEKDFFALQETLTEREKIIKNQATEIHRLNGIIDWFRRQVFGTKSERSSASDINGQLEMLFGEGIEPGTIVEDEISEGHTIKIDEFTRTTGRTKTQKATFDEIIEGLPQHDVQVPATDEERVCNICGKEMEHLGWKKVRTEIVVTPAKYEAYVYYSETLKCVNCSNDEKTIIVETNNVPAALIPRSLASPSLVSNVAMMKYGLYVPNYRLEKYVLLLGVRMTRESMAYQLIYTSENYLVVMYEWLHLELKKRGIINADETPCKVNKHKELVPLTDENGNLVAKTEHEIAQTELNRKAQEEAVQRKAKRKNSYMWMYSSRYGTDMPIVLYDYQSSRKSTCCENYLGIDYTGYLIVDGYSGYNGLKDSTRCGCLAHFRRYWFEAIKRKSGELDETDPAVIGFQFCNRLFHIERELAGLPPEKCYEKRLELEKPLWNKFWEWQEGLEASGGSLLQAALTYARNHRDIMENYMLDGNLPVSNAYAELQAKSYATARKNFLFHQSAEGARSAAIIMSLIETAKANGINPEKYLCQLLECRAEYVDHPENRAAFAPWSDRMKKSCAIKEEKKEEPKVQ